MNHYFLSLVKAQFLHQNQMLKKSNLHNSTKTLYSTLSNNDEYSKKTEATLIFVYGSNDCDYCKYEVVYPFKYGDIYNEFDDSDFTYTYKDKNSGLTITITITL